VFRVPTVGPRPRYNLAMRTILLALATAFALAFSTPSGWSGAAWQERAAEFFTAASQAASGSIPVPAKTSRWPPAESLRLEAASGLISDQDQRAARSFAAFGQFVLPGCEEPPEEAHSYVLRQAKPDMEQVVRSIADELNLGIRGCVPVASGFPKVERVERDLHPIAATRAAERRTSYRIVLDAKGDTVEVFYRKDNETEARAWTAVVFVARPGEKVQHATTRRVAINATGPHLEKIKEAIGTSMRRLGAEVMAGGR
jgi:hypothetical protein